MKRLCFLLAIVTLFSSKASADGLCTDALVKSTLSIGSSVRTDWRLAVLVSEGEWNDASQKGGASAVIYGVPVGANYQDFKSRVSQMSQSYNQSLSTEQLYNLAWTGLDPIAADAYKACLDSQQLGLLVAVRSATASAISLLVRYNGTGNEPPGPITVQWVPPTIEGVQLDTSVPQGGNGHTFQVPRPQAETVLYANYGGITSSGVELGPLPPPLPTPAPVAPVAWSTPHTERNTWAFAKNEIQQCGPSDISGVIIDSVPTGSSNDYDFTVQCRQDHASGVQYALEMAVAQPNENALLFKNRMQEQMHVPVSVTSNPYHSISQSNYWYWYAYKL
jgi:hypothetical protein